MSKDKEEKRQSPEKLRAKAEVELRLASVLEGMYQRKDVLETELRELNESIELIEGNPKSYTKAVKAYLSTQINTKQAPVPEWAKPTY